MLSDTQQRKAKRHEITKPLIDHRRFKVVGERKQLHNIKHNFNEAILFLYEKQICICVYIHVCVNTLKNWWRLFSVGKKPQICCD